MKRIRGTRFELRLMAIPRTSLFILGVDKQCSSTDEVHGLGNTEPGARAVMAHDFITVSGADHVDATRPNSMGL